MELTDHIWDLLIAAASQ